MTAAPHPLIGIVIVGAGSGRRFGDDAKVLRSLAGRPVLAYSLDVFGSLERVQEIVVVAGTHTMDYARDVVATSGLDNVRVCLGGATRSDSVRNGLAALSSNVELVAIHDAARPLVTKAVVERVLDAAEEHGASVPVVPASETMYEVDEAGFCIRVVPRATLRAAQTPQAARREWLEVALRDRDGTDEGTALMDCGYRVVTVEGDPENIKLTWPGDLAVAEAILKRRAS